MVIGSWLGIEQADKGNKTGIKDTLSSYFKSSWINTPIKDLFGASDISDAVEDAVEGASDGLDDIGKQMMQFVDVTDDGASAMSNVGDAAEDVAKGASSAGTSIGGLSGGFKNLLSSITPLKVALVGLTAAFVAYSLYKNHIDKAVTNASSASSTWKESSDSIKEQISSITELRDALDSGKLTEEEAYQTKSELLSIQESLTESYGKQVEGIDLVNGSLEKQIDLLSQVDKESANKFLNENKTGIDVANKEMEKSRHYYLGQVAGSTDEGKALKEILNNEKYKELGLTATNEDAFGQFTIQFDGDVTQAEEVLNKFGTEVREKIKYFGVEDDESNILNSVSQNVSDSLTDANDILDEYQDLYKRSQEAQLVADSDLYGSGAEQKTAVTWLNEYTEAIKNYNNALAEGDSTKIAEAADQFTTLDEKINTLTSGTGMSEYASQFEEVRDQLNETAIAQKKFNDILNTKSTKGLDDTAKKIIECANEFKKLNMSDVDFLDTFQTDGIQKGEDAVQGIVKQALELGLIEDDSIDNIQLITELLVQAGYLTGQMSSNLAESSQTIESVLQRSTQYTAAQEASEKENSGAKYDSMYEMVKNAKELVEAGDVGTDDFKTIAAMFSPSGADDYANWVENLGKIDRYFTEDTSGVKNFLKDLEKNGFAEYNKQTKEWTYSIEDLEAAAKQLGIGFEPFMAMFGKLEDKGFTNDFFVNETEGGDKLAELTEGLFKAQQELDLLNKTDPGNSTAIEAKEKEIDEYKSRIEACQDALSNLLSEGGVKESVEETVQNQGIVKDRVKDFNDLSKKKEYRGDNRTVLESTANKIIEAGKENGLNYELQEVETKTGEIRYKIVLVDEDKTEKEIEEVTDKEYEAEVTVQVDTKELDEMEDDISQEDAKEKVVELIGEDHATPIVEQWDDMEAPDKEATLTGKDKATAVVRLWNYISADDKEGVLSGQDKASWVINTWNQLTPEQKEAILNADGTEAESVLNDILGMTGDVDNTKAEPTIDVTDRASSKINSVSNKLENLDGKKATTTINEITKKTTIKQEKTVKFPYNGTFHADGTLNAHATGTAKNVSIEQDEDAIINEVGKEGVVRDGKLITFNNGYPTKVHLRRGDIVFNHKQMEELEKKGYVTNSHAKIIGGESAFVKGTVISNAYAGKNTGGGTFVGGASDSNTTKKTTPTNNNNNNDDKDNKTTKKTSWSKFEKWVDKLFDWIEIRLDKLAKKTERWTTLAENAVTYAGKALNYQNALSATKTEITANEKASTKYLSQAKTVGLKGAKAANIKNPSKWVNNILTDLQNGRLTDKNGNIKKNAIAKYGEKKSTIISDMNEWFQKSVDSKDKIQELTDSFASLYEELENLANNEAAESVEKIDHELDLLSTNYDLANSLEKRQSNLQEQNQKQLEQLNAYQKAYSSTSSSLEQSKSSLRRLGINADGVNGVDANDNMSTAQLEAVAKYNAALSANKEALQNVKTAQADYNKTIYNNAHQMFENIIDDFEWAQEKFEFIATRIKNAMDLNEAKGYRNSSIFYNSQLDQDKTKKSSLEEEYQSAKNKLLENIRSNPNYMNTDNYKEEIRALNDITTSLDEVNNEIAETQQAINELNWDNFDKLQDAISRVSDEASFLIDELSRKDLTDSDIGGLTEEGQAVMALYAQQYGTAKKQAEMYAEEIKKVKEELNKEENKGNQTLIDHLNELEDSQRDYISSLGDTKDAMIDLATEGLQAQLDYLQDVIDKYKELMDKQEDAYEYQKNLNDAVKEINNIQKQLEVYSGDTSEENRAKIQQLNADLEDKQESLTDMQREKLTSDINDMFDDLMDNYGDYIEDLSENMDIHFNELIEAVNNGLSDTYTTINETASNLGYSISEETKSVQDGNDILSDVNRMIGSTGDSDSIVGKQQAIIDAANTNASNMITTIQTESNNLQKAINDAQAQATTSSSSSGGSTSGSSSGGSSGSSSTGQSQNQAELDRKNMQDEMIAKEFILDHLSIPEKGLKASSIKDPVKKAVFNSTGGKRYISEKDSDKLAKKLGVKENEPLYNRLKELGIFKWIKNNVQISGTSVIARFAKGSKKIPEDMIAEIGEKGKEMVYRSADGSILTPLGQGDMVFTHEMSQRLWDFAKNKSLSTVPIIQGLDDNGFVNTNNLYGKDVKIQIGDINLNGIENLDTFKKEFPGVFTDILKSTIKRDRSVQGLLMDSTVNKAFDKNFNSLSVNRW